MTFDEQIMLQVISLAEKSSTCSEIPVACIITKDGKIIASKHNTKEKDKLSINHAEILAIKEASEKLGNWRLNGCKLYVNLEPCLMCLGAIIESRIDTLIFSAYDYNMGGINGRYGIGEEKVKLTKLSLISGLYTKQNENILKDFFINKR